MLYDIIKLILKEKNYNTLFFNINLSKNSDKTFNFKYRHFTE